MSSSSPEAPAWRLVAVDLREVIDKAGLIEALAAAASFPGWVGPNWDALQDALGDLSWLPAERGWVIVLDGWAGFEASAPADAMVARSILDTAAAEWSTRGRALLLVDA